MYLEPPFEGTSESGTTVLLELGPLEIVSRSRRAGARERCGTCCT